jgi:hypothetical protein
VRKALLFLALALLAGVMWGQGVVIRQGNTCSCPTGYDFKGSCLIVNGKDQAHCVPQVWIYCANPNGCPWLYEPNPEPIDVPAIHSAMTEYELSLCREIANQHTKDTAAECKKALQRWTCADKTRIVMHDEQEPPVYWCHKVQAQHGEVKP